MSAPGPARTPPRRHPRRGITMLELIAVITLLGILAALAVPTMAVTGRAASLRRSAREMAALMRWARATAVLSEIEIQLRLSPDDGLYQLTFDIDAMVRTQLERRARSGRTSGADRRRERGIQEEMTPWQAIHELPSDRTGPLVHFAAVDTEVEIESESSRRRMIPAIIFYPDGTATGGRIVLASRTGAVMQIEVMTATGLAVVTDPARDRAAAEAST